jgi:CTP:molybdopterin cytidylyltransferase MocA
MNPMYTVIVVAVSDTHVVTRPAQASGPDRALQHLNVMAAWETIQALGLPTVLVTDAADDMQTATRHGRWPISALVKLPDGNGQTDLASCLIAGIEASPHADGWLIMPAHLPPPPIETIHRVCAALARHLIAYPIFHGERGTPIGFGKELFSELVHLRGNHDLLRLMSRYPSESIELEDPLTTVQEWLEGVQRIPLRGDSAMRK